MSITIATAPTPIWMRDLSFPRISATSMTTQAIGQASSNANVSGLPTEPGSGTALLSSASNASSGAVVSQLQRINGCYGIQITGAGVSGGGIVFNATWVPVLTAPAPRYTNPLHRFLWMQGGVQMADPTLTSMGVAWVTSAGGGFGTAPDWIGGASERAGFGIVGGPAGARAALWNGSGIQAEIPGLWNDTALHGVEFRVSNRSPSRGLSIEVWVDGTLRGQLASAAMLNPLSFYQLLMRTDSAGGLFFGGVRIRMGPFNALGLPLDD